MKDLAAAVVVTLLFIACCSLGVVALRWAFTVPLFGGC